ncbi:hypothetical protein Tco_0049591, partial [Tanacetum coccineum]
MIVSNHLLTCIEEIVDENQYAFVSGFGRLVSDNILHHQELMSGYHRDQGVSRCAFKDGLVDHGVCLLAINHYIRRVFCGKCGLRQDDPVMGSFRVNVVSVKV